MVIIKHTYLVQGTLWWRRRFLQSEAFPLHSGLADHFQYYTQLMGPYSREFVVKLLFYRKCSLLFCSSSYDNTAPGYQPQHSDLTAHIKPNVVSMMNTGPASNPSSQCHALELTTPFHLLFALVSLASSSLKMSGDVTCVEFGSGCTGYDDRLSELWPERWRKSWRSPGRKI